MADVAGRTQLRKPYSLIGTVCAVLVTAYLAHSLSDDLVTSGQLMVVGATRQAARRGRRGSTTAAR